MAKRKYDRKYEYPDGADIAVGFFVLLCLAVAGYFVWALLQFKG